MSSFKMMILGMFVFMSCKDKATLTQELVREKLEALKMQYQNEKVQECDQRIQEKLDHIADSVLIVLSKKIKYDSLTIPYDSIRPEKPDIEFPEYRKPEKPGEQ